MAAEDAVPPLELDPETMRRLGYRVVDVLVGRIAGLDRDRAWQGATRGEMEARLREPAPASPRDFDAILERLLGDVLPFAGRIDHPRFLAFIPSSPTWPGILADFLASGFNIFQGSWLQSAGPSELELVVLDWFKNWIGYPPEAGGVLVSGGSLANLTALACARMTRPDAAQDGVVYTSSEVHSSVLRAAKVLGFGPDRVRVLAVDAEHRLSPAELATAVEADRRAGRPPLAVVANGGSTSTGSIDPLPELADLAAREGLWLHVDSAYGGFAALTERGRRWLRGIERADSIALDPHKWLYQPYGVGCLLVRDAARLPEAFSMTAPYLQDTKQVDGAAGSTKPPVNFFDFGLEQTRPFRALKIWLSIQYFGVDAFRAAVDRALDLAVRAQRYIEESPGLELVTPARLGIVCFRRRGREGDTQDAVDAANRALVKRLRESGLALVSSTTVDGRHALRFCILNHMTGWDDVERVLRWFEEA